MQSLTLVTLFALCAASMAYSYSYKSVRRYRRSDSPPITADNSTNEVQTKLAHSMGTMANAINREDLPTAAEAGKDIAHTMTVAEEKGLVNHENATEAHVLAGQLEQAANSANKKQATDAAKVMVYRATQVVNSLSNSTNNTGTDRQALDDETEALVNQLQNTMEAMIQSLQNDNLYLAAKHADYAAESANKLSSVTNDRADSVAAEKMTSLAEEMKKASDNGDIDKANEVGTEMSKVSSQIAPDKLKTSIRKTRANTPGTHDVASPQISGQPKLLLSEPSSPSIKTIRSSFTEGSPDIAADFESSAPELAPSHKYRSSETAPAPHADSLNSELLANMTEASAATKSAAQTLRMEEAAKSAQETKKIADRAAETETISRKNAVDIKKAADRVLEAASNDDPESTIENANKLQDKVEKAIVEDKPEIAKNLKKIDNIKDKPVLNATHNEEHILREAVAEVVEADHLIPSENKKEAIDYTVRVMTEGFKLGNTTHGQLVDSVETEAAKVPKPNATESTDRSWYGYGYGYYPGYYGGYGYRNCNYYYAYGHCQGLLYGDYAYHRGYHHSFRRPYHRHYYREDSTDPEEESAETDSSDRLVKAGKKDTSPL